MYVYSYIDMYDYTPVYVYIYIYVCVIEIYLSTCLPSYLSSVHISNNQEALLVVLVACFQLGM